MDAKSLFEILIRENTDMLVAYIRAGVRDEHAVDDLYQETVLTAWKRLDDYERDKPIGPWLRGIAGNLMLAFYRKTSQTALPLDAPRTRFNVPTGAARNFSILHYPLDEIHEMASSQGASINDLVMTLGDLAVNRYLDDKGESPGEPLVVYMPVSLRRGEDDDGNLISLLQVKLAPEHSDPLETLARISESSRSTRELYDGLSRQAISLYTLGIALLPLGEELLRLDQVLPPAINLVISNVPGPMQTMYFRGAEVIEVYPVNTLPPAVALNITVCSYSGKLFFGLISGRTAIPDLNTLANHLDAAYRELGELTKPGRKRLSEG